MRKFVTAVHVISALLLFAETALSQEQLELSEAAKQGLVTVSFSSLGGSSGDTVVATVSRTKSAGSRRLSLSVRPGTILRSRSAGVQSMALAAVKGKVVDSNSYSPSERIEIYRENVVKYLIEAYCSEFEKDNPSESTVFLLSPPDSVLACALEASRRGSLSVPATQAAVWIITDRVDYKSMREKFEVNETEWRQAEGVVRGCLQR